jgi:hypothetical protein
MGAGIDDAPDNVSDGLLIGPTGKGGLNASHRCSYDRGVVATLPRIHKVREDIGKAADDLRRASR